MNNKKTIAIMFGGKSPEHEVTVTSVMFIFKSIDKEKYDLVPIYISKKGKWYTGKELMNVDTFKNINKIPELCKEIYFRPESGDHHLYPKTTGLFKTKEPIKIDMVFPCFHGGLGENGGFQGLFEIMEIPYVGSGITGSAVGFDKVIMKKVFEANNILIAPYDWFYRKDWGNEREVIVEKMEAKFKYPMFVKPANGGSTIGITKVHNSEELKNAIDVATQFDRKVIVEEAITDAREINVSVVGNSGSKLQTSICEEMFASEDKVLSFDDKYKGEGAKKGGTKGMASASREFPAKLPDEATKRIKRLAKKVFRSLDNFGLVRTDFLYKEETDEVFVIETNTIPGAYSFYLWEGSGKKFKDLITELLDLAERKFKIQQKSLTTFQTDLLDNFELGGVKGNKS